MFKNFASQFLKTTFRPINLKFNCDYSKTKKIVETVSSDPTTNSTSNVNFSLLQKNSEIKRIDISACEASFNILKNFNFTEDDCIKIINEYPQFLNVVPEELDLTIRQWKLCEIRYEILHKILTNRPQFLTVDCNVIRKRLQFLISICKKEEILSNLLINCPNVIFDDWQSVLDKLRHLFKDRRITLKEIVKSNALIHHLDFIKFRFNLLEKCGVYKRIIVYPHKVNKFDKTAHKNPPLSHILDLDNKRFATKVAKISQEEYYAFFELTNNIDFETDSDSELDLKSSYKK